MTWRGWESYVPPQPSGSLGSYQRPAPKPNKFKAQPVGIDGLKFASQKEARRWSELRVLESAGHISRLHPHPVYRLEVNGILVGKYTADFAYMTSDGEAIVEDVKGGRATKTEAYSLRKRLFEACHYPLTVTEV